MENLRIISLPLMTLLFASVALAQAGSASLPDAPQPQASAQAQSDETSNPNAGASDDGKLISQVQRYPRLPRRPGRAPRRYVYPSPAPMPHLSPVGALIGFGSGFALGASQSQDRSGGGRAVVGLLVGGIGALIGGVIGTAPPLWHPRRTYPPDDPDDDDDEAALHSKALHEAAKRSVTESVTKKLAPSQSPTTESAALPSQQELAVP
jgi:hypothetical protein